MNADGYERRPIPGFEKYQVDTNGIVYNQSGKPFRAGKRYYAAVTLRKDGKNYSRYVHRLVAETFIPNPNNLPEVNHINGDKTDNGINNLEWVSTKENHDHYREKLVSQKKEGYLRLSQKIYGYSCEDWTVQKEFENIYEVKEYYNLNCTPAHLYAVLNGKQGHDLWKGMFWMWGKVSPEEAKQAYYDPVLRGKYRNTFFKKPFYAYFAKTGEFFKKYSSWEDMKKDGFSHMEVFHVAEKTNPQKFLTYRGYFWSYDVLTPEEVNKYLNENGYHRVYKIYCVETKTIYNSIKEAAENASSSSSLRTKEGRIRCCCRGETQSAYGLHWKYVNENYYEEAPDE